MELSFNSEEKYTEIALSKRIDAISASSFDTQVANYISQNQTIPAFILNLKEVEYVSSAGLRSILKLAKTCSQKKIKLVCCNIQHDVLDVLQISGFTSLLTIKKDITEAVSVLS